MMYQILRSVIVVLFGIMGIMLADSLMPLLSPIIDIKLLKIGFFGVSVVKLLVVALGGVIVAMIGYMVSGFIISKGLQVSKSLERLLARVPSQELMAGTVGLLFGLIIANLIGMAFYRVPIVGPYVPIVLSAILGYIGMRLMARKGPELYENYRSNKDKKKDKIDKSVKEGDEKSLIKSPGSALAPVAPQDAKLLDTSVIIDGRIAEICRTGFLEGTLVVPLFVLEELQHISDSSDTLKRNKGRRGLDILQQMQQEKIANIIVIGEDYEDITEVDSKLMRMALAKKWKIVTNDYNLNKVASLQGISVLNLNDLANALKPSLVSGEWIRVQILKEGKEDGQGIAYLDDGTMIVIENGSEYLNEEIDVMVTSVLQTSAGRMIFAKVEGVKG